MKRLSAFWFVLLIVGFGCGDDDGPAPDTTPPAAVADLSIVAVTDSSASLSWEAPGDDGTSGKASAYDLRYATDMITDENWSTADSVDTPLPPGTAGTEEAVTVSGLSSATHYYFALKTADDASNWSAMSNVVSDTTSDAIQHEEPVLAISADSLAFDSDLTEQTFTITNGGTGPLSWELTENETWLSASPTSGSTTTEEDEITVTVDRSGLAAGSYSGDVTVTPGEGEPRDVAITMTVSGSGPEPGAMAEVPAGSFIMGDGTALCGTAEHTVTLTRSFYLGQTEVTNAEYAELLQWAYDQASPLVAATISSVRDNLDGSTQELLDLDDGDCEISYSGGQFTVDDGREDHPVKEVTWYGAARYCDWLSLQEGRVRAYDHTGDWSCNSGDPYGAHGYRLPTDAEWEYAAQFDDERIYPWGNESPSSSRTNYDGNVGWTTPVGSYPAAPVALGLYDMAGNLWEWCNDRHTCSFGTSSQTDPAGPGSGSYRVLRGGSCYSYDYNLRCAYRSYNYPIYSYYFVGFRVARTVSP